MGFKKRFQNRQQPQKKEGESPYPGTRIAKMIARAGLGSRRDVEAAIEQGRVTVNGRVITSPALNVTEHDKILFDGRPLPQTDRTRLWLYHKPKGLVTTERDPEGRPTVFENLPEDLPRVMSVGRLDINTEGLLLLTNDGDLKRVLELPATGWLRRYRVRAFGRVTQEQLMELKDGASINGVNYGPIETEVEHDSGQNLWLLMGIREGRNREIKNIAEHLGLAVSRLIRISFGPFQLRDLPPGEVREVSLRLLADKLGPRLLREANIRLGIGGGQHRMPRVEKRSTGSGGERGATTKAERYARWQAGDERRIETDENTHQLRLQPKTVSDRKGRKIAVSRSMRESYQKRSDSAEGDRDGWRRRKSRGFRKFSENGFRKRDRFEDGGSGRNQFRQSGDNTPFRKSSDNEKRKPFKKRFESDNNKPYRKKFEGGEKPFSKRFERGDGSFEKKPYKKRFDRDGGPRKSGDRLYKKNLHSFDSAGDAKPRSAFGKSGGKFGKKPFKKRYDRGGGFKRGGKKPFGKNPFKRDH